MDQNLSPRDTRSARREAPRPLGTRDEVPEEKTEADMEDRRQHAVSGDAVYDKQTC